MWHSPLLFLPALIEPAVSLVSFWLGHGSLRRGVCVEKEGACSGESMRKKKKKNKVGETKLPGSLFGVTLVSILKGRGVGASALLFDASQCLTSPPFLRASHYLSHRNFRAFWPWELIIWLAWPSRSHIWLFIWL
jgi:hypothetical protein